MESILESVPTDILEGFGISGIAQLPPGSIIVGGKVPKDPKEFPDWSYVSPKGKTGTMNMDELRGSVNAHSAPGAPSKKRLFEMSPPLFVGAGAGGECDPPVKVPKMTTMQEERCHNVYTWGTDSVWYVEPDVEDTNIDMNPGRYFIGDMKFIRELTSFAVDARDVLDEEDFRPYSGHFSRTRNRGSFFLATTQSEPGDLIATNGFRFRHHQHISIVDTRLFSEDELASNHTSCPGVFMNFPKGLCARLGYDGTLKISDYNGSSSTFTILT